MLKKLFYNITAVNADKTIKLNFFI